MDPEEINDLADQKVQLAAALSTLAGAAEAVKQQDTRKLLLRGMQALVDEMEASARKATCSVHPLVRVQ